MTPQGAPIEPPSPNPLREQIESLPAWRHSGYSVLMSDELLEAVLDALPGAANDVQERLGLTHEQTYEALVRLESHDLASVYVNTPHRGPIRITWERT